MNSLMLPSSACFSVSLNGIRSNIGYTQECIRSWSKGSHIAWSVGNASDRVKALYGFTQNWKINRANAQTWISRPEAGKLRGYGWSTDWPHQLKCFMEGKHCIGNEETLKLCEDNNLASLCRSPLAGGVLTPKPNSEGLDDRGGGEDNIRRFRAIHDVLTSGGRTVVQGALCWLWARSPATIPIPGFRTEAQARENIGALEFGPLTAEQMAEIEVIQNASL
jgi:hypothetical protein